MTHRRAKHHGFMHRVKYGQHRGDSQAIRQIEKRDAQREVTEETAIVPLCSKCGSPDHVNPEDIK